jgi:WD40 repeat protein
MPGEVKVWDTTTPQEYRPIGPAGQPVQELALSPDGALLAVAHGARWDARQVTVYETASGRKLYAAGEADVWVRRPAFSGDGRRLTVVRRSDDAVRVCDAATGANVKDFPAGPAARDEDKVRTISPYGRRLVTAGGGEIQVRDAETGRVLAALRGENLTDASVAFSDDGSALVSVTRHEQDNAPNGDRVFTGSASVWDARTGERRLTVPYRVGVGLACDAAVSGDGRRLAVRLADGDSYSLECWDVATGERLFHTPTPQMVYGMKFSPDATRLLVYTGWRDSYRAFCLDAATGRELYALAGLVNADQFTFSADGRRLLTGGDANPLQVWDAETGEELLALRDGRGPAVFSPDGRRIVSGSADGTVRVWEADSWAGR